MKTKQITENQKFCSCGTPIRQEQKICIECFRKLNNLKWIEPNEIIFDVDNREIGFEAINFIGINLYNENYNFEIWYAEGQKSPHLHLKNIVFLELKGEELKRYKEEFIRKFTPEEYLDSVDFSLCGKHLVAEENKLHFKYHTIKKLCGVFNPDKENYADEDIIKSIENNYSRQYKPDVQGTGITSKIIQQISIIDIARQFGIITNRKGFALCPFHNTLTNSKASLKFYENQGRFICFGCQEKGNIIDFYAKLKELNPDFKYQKEKIK